MTEQRPFPIPVASDADIAAFIAQHGRPYDPETDDYRREPFVADIREGKNDPIYNAHSYHTKVPPRAIIPYILHYTDPGDIILDPFCGSGMTGVAALMCENPPEDILRSVPGAKKGARRAILNDLSPAACHIAYNYCTPVDVAALKAEFERIKAAVKEEFDWLYGTEHYEPAIGLYNPVNPEVACRLKDPPAKASSFLPLPEEERIWELLDRPEVERRIGPESLTKQSLAQGVQQFICIPATIQYTIWSDVYKCEGMVTIEEPTGRINRKTGKPGVKKVRRPRGCGQCFSLWQVAVDEVTGTVAELFACPKCRHQWKKIQLKRSGLTPQVTNYYYRGLAARQKRGETVVAETRIRCERPATDRETAKARDCFARVSKFDLLQKFELWTDGAQYRRNALRGRGIRTAADFYTERNHTALALLYQAIHGGESNIRCAGLFCLTAVSLPMTRMYSYRQSRKGGILKGSLYFPSLFQEMNVGTAFFDKAKDVVALFERDFPPDFSSLVLCDSATKLSRRLENSVDYIFTDPPFGSNIYYSEASLVWDAWLGSRIDREHEAVVHRKEDGGMKTLGDYSRLMKEAFLEIYRVLKPSRWATVEFNNSDGQVFEAIKQAVRDAGFHIENMIFLDKVQKTFKQIKGDKGEEDVVGHDVIFNLRKPPKHGQEIRQLSRTVAHPGKLTPLVAEAIRDHLRTLPDRIQKDPKTYNDEHRSTPFLNTMLMNALIPKGVDVSRLNLPFIEQVCGRYFRKVDNRWYLRDEAVGQQSAQHNGALPFTADPEEVGVADEKSAIAWLRQRLTKTPMRIGELRPHWMKATVKLTGDLSTKLEQFLREHFWLDRQTNRWREPTEEERGQMDTTERQSARHDAERFLSGTLRRHPADDEILSWIEHLYGSASLIEEEAAGLSDTGVVEELPPEADKLYGMMPRLLQAVLKEKVAPARLTLAQRQCRIAATKLAAQAERERESSSREASEPSLFDGIEET